MNTKTFIPFADGGEQLVSKGDIIELVSGERVIFLEMRRTKWSGKDVKTGKGWLIPLYRDRLGKTPYAVRKDGIDKSVIVKSANINGLTAGDLFSIPNRRETFMFINLGTKGARKVVKAKDIASGKNWSIASNFEFIKIDINKLKKELA